MYHRRINGECRSSPALRSRLAETDDARRRQGGERRRRRSADRADRRADQARYQEVTCRSALNRVEGMPFEWTLNPYRGCTHGCHYCFARRYHVQFEMNADDEFASVILVKRNFVEVLARELDRPSWTREQVAFGTATDPYQPIEGHYRLTRGIARRAGARRARRSGSSRRGRWSCATATCCRISRSAAALHRLHERADGRRGRVADARARHGAPAAAAARRARAGRRRHQRRRADGAHRARLLLVALESSNARSRRSPTTARASSAAT